MKKKYFVFLLFTLSLSAQIKGVVKDSITGKPIPYVNIWVQNENIGGTTEENGKFIINSQENKNLVFSALGFKNKSIKSSNNIVIKLQPDVYPLEEVLILKPKKAKQITIGNSENRFYLPEPQVIPWLFARKFQIEENNKELKYLKEIIYFTKSEVKNGLFRVRVYEVNENNLPGEDLIFDEIIITTKKGKHKTIVDISKYNIQIPKEGIIVAFESLLVDQNKYYQQVVSLKPKKKYKILNYSPHIMYFYNDTIEHYNFRSGIWIHFTQEYHKKYDGVYKAPIPAINITLTN